MSLHAFGCVNYGEMCFDQLYTYASINGGTLLLKYKAGFVQMFLLSAKKNNSLFVHLSEVTIQSTLHPLVTINYVKQVTCTTFYFLKKPSHFQNSWELNFLT